MLIKSNSEAVSYLEGFIGKVIFKVDKEFLKSNDPLERMRILLSLLDNPQNKFKSILVGGTSGKGSTAYLISHILKTAGYKTGFTISPHLERINERIQINNKSISNEDFTKLVGSITQTIELMKKMDVGAPSYFEILIAMAFLYFAQEKIDIAVVEVGMGGEFDATNTLYPLIAVITNVSLDHTNVLGRTVQKIAKTKAGIIKKMKDDILGMKNISHFSTLISQLVVVTGVKQPSVIRIVEKKCTEKGAKLLRLDKDFFFKVKKEKSEGLVFDLIVNNDRVKRLNNLHLSLKGRYQVENASLSIETVLELKNFGFEVSEKNIGKALSTAFFPGRFEVIKGAEAARENFLVRKANKNLTSDRFKNSASSHSGNFIGPPRHAFENGLPRPIISHVSSFNCQLILDGAHNPAKMKAFLASLKKIYPKEKKVFIIGFKFDKDMPKMLKQIVRVADEIIVTEFHGKTDMSVSASAEATQIKNQILKMKYSGEVIVEKDLEKVLRKSFNYSITKLPNYPTIVVVTGSLYLVGEIRSML